MPRILAARRIMGWSSAYTERADWGTAVVLDPRELHRLQSANARLRASHRRRTVAAVALFVSSVMATVAACWERTGLTSLSGAMAAQVGRCEQQVRECRKNAARSGVALAALARSNENILAATEQAPTLGTKSWGRRFTVTKYLPHDPKYGRDDDGLTATLKAADPNSHIVAVDPALIPYGSRVWIEGLGWFQAEDCGGAIKGFRLDVLTGTEKDALAFGRQNRFVLVVPADA